MSWTIEQAEVVEWCKKYKELIDGGSAKPFSAILCDPPYHLTSITERFGKPGSAPVKVKEFVDENGKKQGSSPFSRGATGFLGATWDGGDCAFRKETWEAIKSVMYPGAFGFAFSGSKGWHRMAYAIEEAGFIIHPSVFYLYASGFPKSTRIDNQIDKRPGVLGKMLEIKQYLEEAIKKCGKTQEVINTECGFTAASYARWRETDRPDPWRTTLPDWEQWQVMKKVIGFDDKYDSAIKNADRELIGVGKSGIGTAFGDGEWSGEGAEEFDVTAPATPMAKAWAGHRYGGQALKPAVEPIICFQVPYIGKSVECITKTGAGALNIDAARIGNSEVITHGGRTDTENWRFTEKLDKPHSGRWPANFALCHAPECEDVGVGEEEWNCVEGCPVKQLNEQAGLRKSGAMTKPYEYTNTGYSMGAPSGFTRSIHDASEGEVSRFFYNAEWNFEVAEGLLMTPPVRYCPKPSREERDAGLEAFPEKPIFDNESGEFGGNVGSLSTKAKNVHPCLKPVSLNKWLATLLLPPVAYAPRRILVPFAGVGSEMIGALQAGWDEVVGVEMQEEYVTIGKARLEHWAGIGKVAVTASGQKVKISKLEEFE